MIFYSKDGNRFFDDTRHKKFIREDFTPISDEIYNELMKGNSLGKKITSDENGYPILVDYEIDKEKLSKSKINKRNSLLSESDWTELPSAAKRLGKVKVQEWQNYRQALRDITKDPNFPDVEFPQKPSNE